MGALLGPETPKNAGIRVLLRGTGAGCLTMKENDESADKIQEAAGTLQDKGWSIHPQVVLKPSCAGRAGAAPLPAAVADGDSALAAHRWGVLRGSPAVTCLEIIAFLPLQPAGMSLNCGSAKSYTQAGGNLSCRAGLQLNYWIRTAVCVKIG